MDNSQSTISSDQSPSQGTKLNPALLIGGGIAVLLLCACLFSSVGLGVWFGDDSDPVLADEADQTEGSTQEAAHSTGNKGSQNIEAAADMPQAEADTRNDNAAAPEISPFNFALKTTDKGEPIEPTASFEDGVTLVHAVFEYSNLTQNNIWTQVWYHDGNEVLNTSQPWLEDESGLYDYLITANGDPIPSGQWALEFYIDGELQTAGSMTIETSDEISSTAELPSLDDLPRVYKMAYTKWDGEKHNLFVGDTDGSFEQYVLRGGAGPSWSKDGGYLFFYGEEGVDQQYVNGAHYPLPGVSNGVIRLDASPLPTNFAQMQLYQGHGWNDGTARWANVSPDGTMIAYDGDRGGGRRIYFLGTAANQQFRYEIIGEQADWSPDGKKIVYRSGRNNQVGIWISNREDSGHTRITSGGTDSFPAWSPDGETIAFSRDTGGNVDIYTVNVDGSDLKRLTETVGHDTLPAFAPNGDIIFRTARSGTWEIWKMKGDGSDPTRIVGNAPVGPEWSFSRLGVLR
ncbi:MAG: PD40 domain-containing protein [Anaerolineae bacterium]|nr:PD40 domain-containing protein [Anaerolineae bacterium]